MRIAAVAAAAAIIIPNGHATTQRYCAHPSADRLASLPTQYPRFYRALHRHFGAHWLEAAVVSYGEGSWHSWARNGQYLGTFQMGGWARTTYGHSSTLEGQVAHAARYWRAHGWSGWDCQP